MIIDYINNIIYKMKLRRYVKNNLKKGVSIKLIKKKLQQKKINKKIIDDIINSVIKRKIEKRVISTIVIIFIIYVFWLFHFSENYEVLINLPTPIYDFCGRLGSDEMSFPDIRFKCYWIFGIKRVGLGEEYQLLDNEHFCFKNYVDVKLLYLCYNETYGTDDDYYKCGLILLEQNKLSKDSNFNLPPLYDVIAGINFEKVNTLSDLEDIYSEAKPGDPVIIETIYKIKKTRFRSISNEKNVSLGLNLGQAFCPNETLLN